MTFPESPERQRAFPEILSALADQDQPLQWEYLCALSNLGGADLAHFETEWANIAEQRRLEIMRSLEQVAAERYDLIFRQVAQVALRDKTGTVRAAAIANLAMEEDPTLVAPLLEIMQQDASGEARAAAASCLGVYVYLGALEELPPSQTKQVEDALLATQASDEEAPVRRMALEALGFSNRPEVPPLIKSALQVGEEAWLASALLAMGRSADAERWQAYVLSALAHPSQHVQIEAARAAGELESQSAVSELAEMIYYPPRDLQFVAIWALGEIGGVQARSALIKLQAVAEDDEEIQLHIEDALANIDLMEDELGFGLFDPDQLFDLLENEDFEAEDDWY